MKRQRLLVWILPLFLLFLAATGHASAQGGPAANGYKSVNAPPSDILNGTVSLPNPALNGIRSSSAMIPVTLDASGRWSGSVAVDASSDVGMVLLPPPGATWSLTLADPSGAVVTVPSQATTFGLEGTQVSGTEYHLDSAARGLWSATISADKGGASQGFLLVGNKTSATRLHSHLASYETHVGKPLTLVSYFYNNGDTAAEQSSGSPLVGAMQSIALTVRTPDSRTLTVTTPDAARASDGRAALSFVPDRAGLYTVQVTASGTLADGTPVVRTAEHLIAVVEQSVALVAQPLSTSLAGSRLNMALPVQALTAVANGATYKVGAEVWGTKPDGSMAPVAWAGGISAYTNGSLSLSLDSRWISLSGTRAPFELRNVRVQDVATSVPVSVVAQMPLRVDRLPFSNRGVSAPTKEMLMGTRAGTPAAAPESAGKLLLVHGYCSGGVWPTSQFTNAAVFQDFSQNRTHDAFAQIIKAQGAAYSSFGIVAHSQGGAASLHLYTYYWSGLDQATGPRLIQSVGTPYQGTALAGNLALLGQIFGIGCGTNSDLTYDGASLWLSGIPSWARAKIYYATTSPTDVWWRYDYCQAASDLVLDDPDDGTTERWSGQLSGANNLGHKTGWCHTASMRDPAQYNDSSRNANMNSNAAR